MATEPSLLINFVLGGALVLLPLVALVIGAHRDRRRAAAAHREAAAIGLPTTRVQRDLPHFDGNASYVRFERGWCARSAIPMPPVARSVAWRLTVRDRHDVESGYGWWHLHVVDGKLSPAVLDRLRREIERIQYDDGYCELEASPGGIVAYWDDAGGPAEARRVSLLLRELAELHGLDRTPLRVVAGGAVAGLRSPRS